MRKHFFLPAIALFILTAFPASAQYYWNAAGSTATIDEASAGLYEFNNVSLRFKSGQTGTIVGRYTVSGVSPNDPDFNTLIFSYGGPGVSLKLMRAYQCGGYVEEVGAWGPSTDTSANTCDDLDISTHSWDFYGHTYYLEVTLTRTSTSTNPQFHHAQLQ